MKKSIPYFELKGAYELALKIKTIKDCLSKEGVELLPENIFCLTDSELVLIWLRSLTSKFKSGVQALITKITLIYYDLGLSPFQNLNFLDQNKYDWPVDALTKVQKKETFDSIDKRHIKIRECKWLEDPTQL